MGLFLDARFFTWRMNTDCLKVDYIFFIPRVQSKTTKQGQPLRDDVDCTFLC